VANRPVPATIARANGISLRSLHSLFHASGTTLAAWLKEQRLARSRDALNANASGRETLTEIAFRCGFRRISAATSSCASVRARAGSAMRYRICRARIRSAEEGREERESVSRVP
jgi:AraC-like DNA-binding protein